MVCLNWQDSPVLQAPFSLPLISSYLGQSHVCMHPQDSLIVLAPRNTYFQTLNRFKCLLYSHRFYLQNKRLKHHNQIIYTCIFIRKILQNNPILICIVRFLVCPRDPASLCKPWDRLWTWMLGQHAGCFTTSFYIYQAQSSQPTVGFIRPSSQANKQLGLSGCSQSSQYIAGFIRLLSQAS